MARRRGDLTPVFVDSGNLKYGFKTTESIYNSYGKTELGQTSYEDSPLLGVVFGANAPKPYRAAKEFASGTISSFCSDNKVSALKKNNWIVSRRNIIRGISNTTRTKTVYVTMPGGWNYAWNITKDEADLATELGFKLATASDDLVWGVNNPKPPRAKRRSINGSVSTFIQPTQSVIDAARANGWSITKVSYDVLP